MSWCWLKILNRTDFCFLLNSDFYSFQTWSNCSSSFETYFLEFQIYSSVLIGIQAKPENSLNMKIFDDKITPLKLFHICSNYELFVSRGTYNRNLRRKNKVWYLLFDCWAILGRKNNTWLYVVHYIIYCTWRPFYVGILSFFRCTHSV